MIAVFDLHDRWFAHLMIADAEGGQEVSFYAGWGSWYVPLNFQCAF